MSVPSPLQYFCLVPTGAGAAWHSSSDGRGVSEPRHVQAVHAGAGAALLPGGQLQDGRAQRGPRRLPHGRQVQRSAAAAQHVEMYHKVLVNVTV